MIANVSTANRVNFLPRHFVIADKQIYTSAILNLFKLSEKIHILTKECIEGEKILDSLRTQEKINHVTDYAKVEEKGPPIMKKVRKLRELMNLFILEKDSEQNRLTRLIGLEALLIRNFADERRIQNKLCIQARQEMAKEFLDRGKETNYCLSKKHLIKMAEIVIEDTTKRCASIALKKRIHEIQLELINDRKKIKILNQKEYEALHKKVPVNIAKVTPDRHVLKVAVEPCDVPCRFELVGNRRSDKEELVLELCAIPGKSVQNCSNLEFEIDRDLLSDYKYTFPVCVVFLQTNGESKQMCTIPW